MKITGNEPAYPVEIATYDGKEMPVQTGNNSYMSTGITIRQQFAMAAMQGCLASGFQTTMNRHAESAVEAADALIAELNRTEADNV